MNEIILTVKNAHPDSGTPPQIEAGSTSDYTSYFETVLLEQWMLRWNRKDPHITLYSGEIGWDKPQTLPLPPKISTMGEVDRVTQHLRKHLKFEVDQDEQLWLFACMTAIAFQRPS